MKTIALLSLIVAVVCVLLYIKTLDDVVLSLAITFGTIAYHFGMRLMVGLILNAMLQNQVDYRKKWFQVSKVEQQLYKKLKVKSWKNKMPTYDETVFDRNKHTWDEIAQAMCQSELVHETIIVLSFIPIVSSVWFGALPVFIITSILSAIFDALFVIMQRFNRPRIIKLIER